MSTLDLKNLTTADLHAATIPTLLETLAAADDTQLLSVNAQRIRRELTYRRETSIATDQQRVFLALKREGQK